MPTNTYDALRTTTVGTSTPSVTFDLTGISGYTDLVLVSNVRINQSTSSDIYCQPNGVGTANKSFTFVIGNGSTATSGRGSNDANIRIGAGTGTSQASGIFATSISHFMNYSNTTTFKTILSRGSDTTNASQAIVGLFPSTNAITSIVIYGNAGVNILAGSTFSLYGIRAEGVSPAAKATGGTIYSDSTYYYHVFGSTGVFTPTQSISADVFCVAGGGGGGYYYGAGGGAGGVQWATSQSLTAIAYPVTIGAGGPTKSSGSAGNGTVGVDSSFSSLIIAKGGGYGAGAVSTAVAGGPGGSGGGAGGGNTAFAAGGSAVAGTGGTHYGNAGGGGSTGGAGGTGGGGGGGAVGGARINTAAANGGIGLSGITLPALNAIGLATGVGILSNGNYYIAGGGSDSNNNASVGGLGGGGNYQASGLVNTGGGAGGDQGAGGGGSGVVIVRYLKA